METSGGRFRSRPLSTAERDVEQSLLVHRHPGPHSRALQPDPERFRFDRLAGIAKIDLEINPLGSVRSGQLSPFPSPAFLMGSYRAPLGLDQPERIG